MKTYFRMKRKWGEEEMEREQTTIRLPAELKEKIQQEADRRGMSFNQLLLIIIDAYINPQK